MKNEIRVQVRQQRLTESQEELFALVSRKKSVAIDEVSDRIQDIKRLISEGYMQLKASVYSWGLDFELEPAYDGGSRTRGNSE